MNVWINIRIYLDTHDKEFIVLSKLQKMQGYFGLQGVVFLF